MPRSMADPDYVYTPWSPGRRKAASLAGKARWARRRGQMPQPKGITGEHFLGEMKRLGDEHYAAVERMEEMLCAARYMSREFPELAEQIERQYKRLARITNWA